jgi:protein SCO1/2
VLAQTRKALGDDAARVQVVYVTVDPEKDNVAHLREFLARFDPAFVGGTGTEEELAAVRKGYGVTSTKIAFGDDYGFDHSSYTYLIDRDGNLSALMPYGHSADDYVHDVKILLAR